MTKGNRKHWANTAQKRVYGSLANLKLYVIYRERERELIWYEDKFDIFLRLNN